MMRRFIEDFAMIGDLHTAALISRDGNLDWLCLPRFDSDAAFCALLGTPENGRWSMAPVDEIVAIERRYEPNTLILETTIRTRSGVVRLLDFMPRRKDGPMVVRIVRGISGTVAMETRIGCRFSYGRIPPWLQRRGDHVAMTIGADGIALRSSVELQIEPPDVVARFAVSKGKTETFVFEWHDSSRRAPRARDAVKLLDETRARWRRWAAHCDYKGTHRREVLRSLITLRALIYDPTGGSVAAPTTSLPERLGGSSNWDYRYSWIRDSAFTVAALISCGYHRQAESWRDWLLRVLAGAPERLQIMHSITGERRLEEFEADWLGGYEGSKPVRIGNQAYMQFQLGIYGHLMQAIFAAHKQGLRINEQAWARLTRLIEHVAAVWQQPDSGIWEYRSRQEHYTLSRVMAWVAMDIAVRAVTEEGYEGPADRWQSVRDEIAAEIHERAFNYRRNAFVEFYGSDDLDASLLLMPLFGFLPIDDDRWKGTLEAIERELCIDGFVMRDSRHVQTGALSGAVPTEGAFVACNMWLVENYAMAGRLAEARALFSRVLGIANDVGLLAEEYDVRFRRQVGNFPQTFSHATLINAALRLRKAESGKRRS